MFLQVWHCDSAASGLVGWNIAAVSGLIHTRYFLPLFRPYAHALITVPVPKFSVIHCSFLRARYATFSTQHCRFGSWSLALCMPSNTALSPAVSFCDLGLPACPVLCASLLLRH